ncbi:hypothetical protein [Ammoniphilus oxalaticus]|uniref:hypothetical protein n=1 Tax=Ammoniphilus oxalaticus TaxID=66863 RepID=UPI0014762823|nr:hypothetical protein [Ammoniphilus oxalaticus]
MKKVNSISLNVDTTELVEVLKKVERFKELLKEANSLADELASKEIKINIDSNLLNQ